MANHAIGEAISNAINTSFTKSFESSAAIPVVDAPSTLRTPISFLRCAMLNADSPNKPRQAIKIAIDVNALKIFDIRSSDLKSLSNASSKK